MCVKRQKNLNNFAFLRDETSWMIFHCAENRAKKASKQNAFLMDVSGGDAPVH